MSSYGTVGDADEYHAARGNTEWASATDKEQKLLRASEFIDTYRARFPGSKAEGRSQEREWPRRGAVDLAGELISDDEIPSEVERATYEAALLIVKGVSLTETPVAGTSAGVVLRKKVKAGPVETETEYDVSGTGRIFFQTIGDLLENVLNGRRFGASVEITRV